MFEPRVLCGDSRPQLSAARSAAVFMEGHGFSLMPKQLFEEL
jgi:hypothetical protein